jgi:hypothetical protein
MTHIHAPARMLTRILRVIGDRDDRQLGIVIRGRGAPIDAESERVAIRLTSQGASGHI